VAQDVVVVVPEFCNVVSRPVMRFSTASAGRAATIVTCRSVRKTTTVLTDWPPDATVAAYAVEPYCGRSIVALARVAIDDLSLSYVDDVALVSYPMITVCDELVPAYVQVVVVPLTVACGSRTTVPRELLMRDGSTSEQMGWSPRFGLVVVVVDAAVDLVTDDAEDPLEHDVRQMAPANPAAKATAVSPRLDGDRRDAWRARRRPLVRVIVSGTGSDVQLAMAPTT
jgi:hypothetical protein